MLTSREQQSPLSNIFEQRKNNFLDSLQHILQSVGSDLFIRQMFDNKSSEVFVPDRICEIVEQNLKNDKEKYINQLEKRLRAFEACFGKDRVKKFEEIGNNILDHSEKMKRMKNFNLNDKENQAYIEMIKDEFKQFTRDSSTQSDLQFSTKDIKPIKDKIHSINEYFSSNTHFFKDIQNQFIQSIKSLSKEAKSVIKNARNKNDKQISTLKKENEKRSNSFSIEKDELEKQVNFLKEQIDQKDEIIQSFKESQAKSNEQFQSTLQKISQKDKEISNLQRSLSLASNDVESNSMKQRIATLEADLEFSKTKLFEASQIQGEKNAMSESLRLIQDENSSLRNQITEKELELHSYQNQIKEMRDTFGKLKESMPERKQIMEKIQQLQAKNRQMKSTIEDQKNKIDDLQTKKKQLTQKVELLSENLNEKNEMIQKIRGDFTDTVENESEKKMTINQLKEKIKEYEAAIKMLTKKVKQKQIQCSSLTKENKDIRNEMVDVREELKRTKDELESTFDSLQSLKEESRSKDSIIDDFKSSLKKSSLTIRDLNSANLKINEQSLIIKSNEETNSQLMNEVSKQEEKIKEITEKLIDYDKKLKKQIQINFAQSKQNETLSALNAKQEKEINEAHSQMIDLHARLLQYESDTQNHSDSIKILTNDNNREVTERKLIESYINKERERYHDEVDNLQKKISQYIVEKTDLSHKLDQVTFENSTIKQLLQSREKELKIEKQKNAEDLSKMREMTSKVFEENEKLRRMTKEYSSKSSFIPNEYLNNSFPQDEQQSQANENTIDDNNLSLEFNETSRSNTYANGNDFNRQQRQFNGRSSAGRNNFNDQDNDNYSNSQRQGETRNNFSDQYNRNSSQNQNRSNNNEQFNRSNSGKINRNNVDQNRSNYDDQFNRSNSNNFNRSNIDDQYNKNRSNYNDNYNRNPNNQDGNYFDDQFNRNNFNRSNNDEQYNRSGQNRSNSNNFNRSSNDDQYNRSNYNDNYTRDGSNIQDGNYFDDQFDRNNRSRNGYSNRSSFDDQMNRSSPNSQSRNSIDGQFSRNSPTSRSRNTRSGGRNNFDDFDSESANSSEDTIGQLKQIRRLLECENDGNAVDKLAQIKDENNELKQVHAKLQELCGSDDVISSVQRMKKQNQILQEQGRNDDIMQPFSNSDDSSYAAKVLAKTKSLLHCSEVSEIPSAIQQLSSDNKALRSNLETIKKVVPSGNSSFNNDDLVSTITDAFKENKLIKSQLLGSPGARSPRNAENSNTAIEKIKDESSNFQMIKKSLSRSSSSNISSNNNEDVTRKVIEMQNNERKLQEILHSNDVVSSVQNIVKENEKLKNNEKNLSKMINQSSFPSSPSSAFSSSSFADSSKSPNEKIAEIIHENAELKKTHNAIQNLLPASTQVNMSTNRSGLTIETSGSRRRDQFSMNMKTYQERVANLVNENKKLKQEKEEVEKLLRPYQKGDNYSFNDDEIKSPHTIHEILQENKKLKQIQKSACSIIGSNEDEFESKVKELVETKKKIESILPYQEEETNLSNRVSNLMKENELLKDSMESISRMIPKKNRRKSQSAFSSPTSLSKSLFNNSENENNNSYSFSDFNTEETVEDSIRNYVEQNETLNKKIRKIKAMIPGHFNDIEEGIDSLLKENRKLKQDQINARHAIPSFLAKKIKRNQKKKSSNQFRGSFNQIEFEEEEEEQEQDQDYSINVNDESLVTDFPHLIEELAKEAELLKEETDEVSGILPGNRTDPVIDRLNKLINEKNSLEDNENEIKEILADFTYDEDEDVISIVKNLANKVRQIGKIIPIRSPKQFASSCPNSPPGSPVHLFGFNSDLVSSPDKKTFDFVSSVKRLVNDNSRLEEIQREADELISENFTQNPNQSLVEKINSLLTSNAIFKAQQERISKLIFNENSESGQNSTSIENRIIELLTENQELKQTESELAKIIPSDKYKKGTIQENVRDILIENEQNETIKEKVKKMLNDVVSPNSPSSIDLVDNQSDFSDDNNNDNLSISKKPVTCLSPTGKLETKVQSLIRRKKEVENEMKQIEEILPHDEDEGKKSIQERIQHLVDENKSLKDEKGQLNSLFADKNTDDDEISHSKSGNNDKNVLKNVSEVLSTINELQNILPQKTTNLPEAFQSIVAENEALHKQKSELEKLMTSSDSSVPSNLSAKLQSVLQENADLRKMLNRVMALFPNSLPTAFDDIIIQIRLLIENSIELRNLRNEISDLLRLEKPRPSQALLSKLDKLEKDNMIAQIKNLVDQCQLLKSDKETLNKIRKILFNDDENDDNFLSFSVTDEVQRLVKSKEENDNFSQTLFDMLHCESLFEVIQKVEDSQKNLSCLTELTTRLFDAIAAPSRSSPIRLAFPIYEKRKISLFSLIDSFRKRLVESQQTVETVIEKARKFGFNGGSHELPAAVKFLEEMSALAERQKLDENFMKEVEQLREVTSKQQKIADQNREKFKKKMEEKVALANELQEKLNQKEAWFIQEVDAERKKARQFGILAEKQKRIIAELVRVISGKGADLEFLKSNLSVAEAVALQYADAIHDAILKIQNDGHLFL